MKMVMLMIGAGLSVLSLEAQEVTSGSDVPQVNIAQDKTTTLVFPCAVTYVDRGTPDVLIKALKEAPDKLLLKAGKTGFSPTSLSVMTGDGRVYCFLVHYEPLSPTLVRFISLPAAAEDEATQTSHLTDWEIKRTAGELLLKKEGGNVKTRRLWEMQLTLQHIYIRKDVLFFSLSLTNHSEVPYPVEALRFAQKDRKKSKRTSRQEQGLNPMYVAGKVERVEGGSTARLVVALPAFTLPEGKRCFIELSEREGGRWLNLKIRNRQIVRASIFP